MASRRTSLSPGQCREPAKNWHGLGIYRTGIGTKLDLRLALIRNAHSIRRAISVEGWRALTPVMTRGSRLQGKG